MTVKSHRYRAALLGLPVTIQASSWPVARRRLLRRWVHSLTVANPTLPLVPTLVLLETDDARAVPELLDERFRPPAPPKYSADKIVSIR